MLPVCAVDANRLGANVSRMPDVRGCRPLETATIEPTKFCTTLLNNHSGQLYGQTTDSFLTAKA
ncbi:hypothetical protein QC762_0040200 [Podospora pseudocomata]|uniref:Uncharacterized protein n=1 Tax=Podospora pseudocomata TaxID=2093779 RepID=A0ABR0GMJ1_9PEZI|nr:hypothetical protein QC762_0040200 [Podospora pseudocomata]